MIIAEALRHNVTLTKLSLSMVYRIIIAVVYNPIEAAGRKALESAARPALTLMMVIL